MFSHNNIENVHVENQATDDFNVKNQAADDFNVKNQATVPLLLARSFLKYIECRTRIASAAGHFSASTLLQFKCRRTL